MKRKDKILAVRRYITAYSGIPVITWDGVGNALEAPYPYGFIVSTDRSNNRFIQIGRGLNQNTMSSVVRYDADIDHVGQALVLTHLQQYASLLKTHYEVHQRPTEGE